MPLGGGSGEGGLAARGYNGPAQPGSNASSGVGGGASNGGGGASNGGGHPVSQNWTGGRLIMSPIAGQPPTVNNSFYDPYGYHEITDSGFDNYIEEGGWQDLGSAADWNAQGRPGLTQGPPRGNPGGGAGYNSGQGGMGAGGTSLAGRMAGRIFGVGRAMPRPAPRVGQSPRPGLGAKPRVDPARIRPGGNGPGIRPPTISPPAVRTPQFRGSLG